jgi:amino acid transporter
MLATILLVVLARSNAISLCSVVVKLVALFVICVVHVVGSLCQFGMQLTELLDQLGIFLGMIVTELDFSGLRVVDALLHQARNACKRFRFGDRHLKVLLIIGTLNHQTILGLTSREHI